MVNTKVLCVSDLHLKLLLTKGIWYKLAVGDITSSGKYTHGPIENCYCVLSDRDTWSYIDKSYFKTVDQIREDKLKEILDESIL